MAVPPVRTRALPWAIPSIPSVTMKEGNPRRVTRLPLMKPTSAPRVQAHCGVAEDSIFSFLTSGNNEPTPSFSKEKNAIQKSQNFGKVRRYDDHRHSFTRKLSDQAMDLTLTVHRDPSSRIV